MFILTNSEELVKDVFELFSKFNHPGLHGADHGRIKLLLCQGLAPTAYLVYYCVKDMSRIFFKSLTQAAGRRPQVAGRRDIIDVAVGAGQRAARCGNPVKCFVAKSLFTGRESSPAAIYSSFIVRRSSICWHSMSKKNHLLAKYCQASITSRKTPSNPAFII